MRLACSIASFPQDRLEIAIAKTGWAGYTGVELLLQADLPSVEEVRERLRLNELELAAVHAGTLPLAHAEHGLDELGRIGRAATFARGLDGTTLVVTAPAEGSLEGLAATLRLLDGALKDVAVDTCLANRRGTLLASPEDFARLWSLGLPERVGVALDPAEALLAGWEPVNLEALPEFPRHVYLTDASQDRPVPPGEGRLDLARLGAELRQCGYGGPVVVVLQNADPWAVEPLAKETRELAAEHLTA